MTTSCGWVAEYLPTQPSAPNALAAHCRPAGSLLLRHRGIGVSRGQPSRRASCLPYVPGWRAHVIAIVSPAPLSVRLSCRLLPLRLPSASVVRACPPPHHPYPKRRKHFLILPPPDLRRRPFCQPTIRASKHCASFCNDYTASQWTRTQTLRHRPRSMRHLVPGLLALVPESRVSLESVRLCVSLAVGQARARPVTCTL